jgi:hypothetical protein
MEMDKADHAPVLDPRLCRLAVVMAETVADLNDSQIFLSGNQSFTRNHNFLFLQKGIRKSL